MEPIRIEEIDKNLKVETSIDKEDIVWLSPKDAPFSIHGLCEVQEDMPYHRIPQSVAEATNPGVRGLMWNTAGGRIRFATDSPYIAIKAVMPATVTMPHMAKTGQSGFDIYVSDGTNTRYLNTFKPPYGAAPGYEGVVNARGRMRTYTINMPLYDSVQQLYIGLAKSAQLAPAEAYLHTVPVVYYGSSITQGGCASRPGNSYQSLISRMYDTDYINLGFSGSARGEKAMVDYLASIKASVFVLDYDHNAPSAEHLQATHLPLYRTYREKNPDTPIVMVSKPDFNGEGCAFRRGIIYDTYRTAVNEGDKNVYFIDGETLFAGECRDACTVDGCHPNDLGFFRMAQVIGEVVGKLL